MADEKISLGDLLKEEPKEKQTKKVSLGNLLKEEPVKKKELELPSTDFSASSQFLQEKPTSTQIPFKTGVEKPKVRVNRENIIKRAEAGEVNPDLNELSDLNQRLIKGGVLTAGEIERGELDKGDIDDFTLRTRAVRDLREKSIEKSKALETGAKKLQQQGQALIQQYEQAPSPELKSQIEQLDKDYQLTVREYNKERYKQDIYEKRLVQTSDSIKKLANENLPTGFFEGAWKRIKENPKEFIEYVDLFRRSKAEQIQFAKDAYLKMPTKEQDLFSRGSMGQMLGDVTVDGLIALGFSLGGSPVMGAAAVSAKQGAIQAGEDFVRAFNKAKEEGIETGELDVNGKPIVRIPTDDEAYDIATKSAGVGFGTGALEGLAGVLTGGAATKAVGKVAEKTLPKAVAKVAERGTDVAQDVLLAGGLQTGRNVFDKYQGLQTELLAGVPQNMLAEGFLSTAINVPGAVKDIRKIKASEAAKEQIFESVVNAKDNPEELKKLTENLEIIKNQGLVTESEYNDIVKKVQQYEQALPTIPEEIKNKKAAADLIIERNDLAEKAQTVDEAYKKPIEERIKQINEELLKVDEKPITPPPSAEVTLPEVEVVAEKPAPTEGKSAEEVVKDKIEPSEIELKTKETEGKIKRKDLFDGVGEFSSSLGGSDKASVPILHKEINGIELVQYAHPQTGSIDVIVTGTSDNDFVGFYRIYENGKPTNKWSSKFENKSRNKEAFKTMISGVQKMLPIGHEYTEKTSISTDGLRVWNQQLNRGYELQYDENGKLKTNLVAINGDAIVNELGIPVEKGQFENIKVKSKEEFEIVKKAILPYLEKFGLNESNIKWLTGTVKIDLPILKQKEVSKSMESLGKPKAEAKPAEEVVAVEKPITETTYNFEKDKPENAAKFDYYTREEDGITKYFKKEKPVEEVKAEEVVPEGEKKKTTKVSDFLRKNLTTKPIVFKDKDGNEIIVARQGLDWNDMVNKVADLIDKGYEAALAVKEYLKSQDWFKSLNKDQQDAVIEQSVTNFETSIKEAEKVTETTTEIKEEVVKKNTVAKLKDKISKLRGDVKESKYQQRWKEAEAKLIREYEVEKQKAKGEKELKDLKEKHDAKLKELKNKILELEYQQRWNEAEANFMKEYELAKQKGASDAKLKEMTDKYKSKVKSLEEELKQEKKERKYELKYLEAEANTVKDWLGENKSLLKGLTDSEYQRLIKKLTGTGLRSDIDDVMEYIDKMVGNADYNNKLTQAKKLNKGLKLLSKSKSTLVNEREALKKFISVKPSSSWDVVKLDKYNQFAQKLINSVSPAKNVKGKAERDTKNITTEQIDNEYEILKNDYDNEVLSKLIKDNAWYFINKKFTTEDIDKIKADLDFINGKDLDAQKQALKRLEQRKDFKEAMKEIVSVQIKKITDLDKTIRDGFSKDDNLTIDRLKNIDVNKLDTRQLIKINNILNNIETNGDFSNAGYVDVIAKFQKAIPKIDGILKNSNLFKFKNTKIWDTIRTKRSLDAIMQRLTLVNRTAASKLNVAFGDTDLSLNNVKVNEFVKKVLETIQKYEDTKPSVKDEHTNEVVAYLIQNTATTDAEKEAQFKQAKDNLKTSYENLKRGNKDEQNLGKLQEEIYKDLDLDNVNNQQQLIDKYSKMNKTAMDYLFKMQKVYEEIEPLFRKNQELYNNTTYQKIQYYTPIKHRTLSTEVEEDLKGEEEYLKSSMGINASMSKSSIKRVGMNKNQYIDTDFNKLMYTRANDIANQAYTLPDRAFMHELFNSKEFLELFGENNAKVLRDAFESKVNHVMNKYPIPSKTQKKINDGLKPLDRMINLSSVRALNGALQSVKQMVVLVNTISDLTLSGNADLIDKSFKAKWDKSFETFLKRMPISSREGTKGGTNLSKDIDEITESKIRTELENLYKAYGLSTENMAEKTLYFLRKGDLFPAELSWAAYYMESLKNQGIDVDNINWEQENNKINDGEESRKEAIAYAEAKVSSKQNVSDPANVSELIANKDVLVRIVRSLIAPLSSYAINTRNRLNDDFLAIAKGGDKKAAAIDITATIAELYAYGVMINVISAFILEPAMEMMLDEFGFDPEKDPREWDEILKDIFTKKAAWNAMADFLTTGTTIFGEKYGKEALNAIYTALNGKTKNANDYFNITPEESKKNEKEQNDYDRTLPFRTKTLTETFGKAGTLGILLDLSTNALSSLSYVYDDEGRMKEGVRLGKTRVEGLKKGEFEKSYISPVELTPNEEKFFIISGMISATTMMIPMFSEITSVNRMAYQKAIRQAKAKYGETERTSAGEPFAKKEPTGFYTNVFKLMDDKEKVLKSGLSSSVKNEKLKEIDEKLKREYMRRAGVNEVTQEQFSRFLRDLTKQREERIRRGLNQRDVKASF